MSRYNRRKIYRTNNSLYAEDLKKKGLNFIRYFQTPTFKELTAADMKELTTVSHIWKMGDRFYKLAHEFYGDAELWWIIARFNKKPTEGHIMIGETIRIPTPLWKIREIYGA